MTWQEIGALIGALSGLAGLFLNWRTRSELKLSRRPVLSVWHQPGTIWPNSFRVKLRSRSNIGWQATTVRVLWPRDGLVSILPDAGSPEKRRSIDPGLRVANEGRKSRDGYMGTSDEHQVSLLLFLPSLGSATPLPYSRRVWMLVTLEDEIGTTSYRLCRPRFTYKARK